MLKRCLPDVPSVDALSLLGLYDLLEAYYALRGTAERIKQVNSNVKVLCHCTEATSEPAVETLYDAVGQEFKKVDVLINNAGTLNNHCWNDFVSSVVTSACCRLELLVNVLIAQQEVNY